MKLVAVDFDVLYDFFIFFPSGTVLGTLAAVDIDGPEPISYTIESEDTRSLVSLSIPEGSSDDIVSGRHVNVTLIFPLDRDYVSRIVVVTSLVIYKILDLIDRKYLIFTV